MTDPLATFIEQESADESTLGLLLHGSHAGGAPRDTSDYDLIRVVVGDGFAHDKCQPLDIVTVGIERLEQRVEQPDWYTATFAYADVLLDKGGVAEVVRRIVDRAGEIAYERVPQEYDAYLNYWVRSLKAWRNVDELGARLHAAASTVPLINALFGLEHRWPPYLDRLDPVLPELAAQGWGDGELRYALLALLRDGSPAVQRPLEAKVEALMRSRGFEHEWGTDLEPLKRG